MVTEREALKSWYRSRIRERHRDASRLAIEVALEAQDKESVDRLAESMDCVDQAVELLERARDRLVTIDMH